MLGVPSINPPSLSSPSLSSASLSAPSLQQPSADISSSDYAKWTRALINLIKDLRALGAQADFDLPRIAVIGNQSAGKSSLVEAISGITVPRASGTCTRCPMECRLIHSTRPWQCQVLLRRETDENGVRISAKETPFGPLLHDKSLLEEMLRRAQLAVLNPSLSPSFFEDFDTKSLKPGDKPPGSARQLAFSNDVVCIDLQAPEVTDLSFIDLPGIISNVASGDDRGNIEAVKTMVQEHIKGNTLILLAITMRDDIDNQGAAFLAHEEDNKGLRTIGVLTKPDLIQQGEEDAWMRILEGSNHVLKHGYYVTKQPSPKELEEKITFETARQREITFFEGTSPWKDKQNLRSRMGTPNLTKELSRLLGTVISQALPGLRKGSKDSYQQVKQLLDDLPPPPSDSPSSELLRLATAFSADVENIIQGRDSYERLIQQCRPVYKAFKHDIRGTAPKMRPFEKPELDSHVIIDIGADSDSDSRASFGLPDLSSPASKSGVMYLKDVREHIERSLTRQLPYNVPFVAKVSLIENIFRDWDQYSLKCFDAVYAATLKELKKLADQRFGRFNTALPDHITTIVENLVESAREKTLEKIEWMLELENPPFTMNDHYFSTYREKYLARYKKARKPKLLGKSGSLAEMPFRSSDQDMVTQALTALSAAGYSGVTEADLAKLRGADMYEEELIVMAETSAYFHIAYKRIIDNIPRIIDHDFLGTIAKEIQSTLIQGLSLGTEQATERASHYLAEDVQVASQRAHLKQKKERLEGVLKKLYEFGM